MDYKLFIVEDNQELVALIKKGLASWGFSAESCQNFNQVDKEIAAAKPQLILMDVNLPFFNGFYWTQKIRQTSQVPIIFLSSRSEDSDQIMAMNFGADDYITKPFNMDLLIVKIKALLRREYDFSEDSGQTSFLNYTLNLVDNQLWDGANKVALTKNETKLLHLLFSHPRQTVSKEEIMTDLWEDELFIDRNTLSVTLARLRSKVGEIGLAGHIKTIKGKGVLLDD
ncbi:response regulator transcription factor [Eupransor demetentiae]|uniref:OmpR family n=1 Tax=Eupransor demetentiae TaxID=3109584 RepID=A0ABM9N5C2_9LACO|nr:DNA-binding response regulator [Lactobacillaceae bacterium LMG 33000]